MTKQEYIAVAILYFGDALAEVGELSVKANEKHNPGEPTHWSRDKSNDHWGSWGRHMSNLGHIDPESELLHDVSWLWRSCAINQIRAEEDVV